MKTSAYVEIIGKVLSELGNEPTEEDKQRHSEFVSWRENKLIKRAILNRFQAQGIGRNSLCPCGSGMKYKKCHLVLLSNTDMNGEALLKEFKLVRASNEK